MDQNHWFINCRKKIHKQDFFLKNPQFLTMQNMLSLPDSKE